MTSIRVALVDHQRVFSRGLELLLPALTESRVRVVATTDDAAAASMLVRQHMPDLAVVDLDMPAPGGLRAIAAIRRTEPDVPVIAMADVPDPAADGPHADLVVSALRAGAGGFLQRTGEPEGLIAPLMAVFDGWAVVPAPVLRRLLSSNGCSPKPWRLLTDSEREVWKLIAAGYTTQRMAAELHVSERTAKRLTAALLRRLGVANRLEAATLAGRNGVPGVNG